MENGNEIMRDYSREMIDDAPMVTFSRILKFSTVHVTLCIK